jgi:hypothetical protein
MNAAEIAFVVWPTLAIVPMLGGPLIIPQKV